MKKVLKVIGIILLALVLLALLAVLIMFLSENSHRKQDREALAADGLYYAAEAGDITLNVPRFGSETAAHTVIAMPGSQDAAFAPAMQNLFTYISEDVQLAVVERPGYGLSDVGKEDMTVEYVVECTREALKSSGLEAPYVLMPHSLSGMYATYWLNTYPEEIEGVLFLDSVFATDDDEAIFEGSSLMYTLTSLGVVRSWMGDDPGYALVNLLPEQYHADANKMVTYRPFNRSLDSETALYGQNIQKAWDSVKSTDIPKLYVTTEPGSLAEMKEKLRFEWGEEPTDEEVQERYDSYFEMNDEAYMAKRSEYINNLGNCHEVNLPGSHFMYLQHPKETAMQLEALLALID